MRNTIINILCILFAAAIIWIMVSWVDVLAHNEPCYGDRQYQEWNAIVLVAEALQ